MLARDGSRPRDSRGAKAPSGNTIRFREKVGQMKRVSPGDGSCAANHDLLANPLAKKLSVEYQTTSVAALSAIDLMTLTFTKKKENMVTPRLKKGRSAFANHFEVGQLFKLDCDTRSPHRMVYMDESFLHVHPRNDVPWFELEEDHRSTDPEGHGQIITVILPRAEDCSLTADK